MSCSVCCSSATVGLTALSVLERLTAERPLVDFSVSSTREWDTEVFQLNITYKRCSKYTNLRADLNYSVRRLTTHVMDSVLITKPVRTFDLFSRALGKLLKET